CKTAPCHALPVAKYPLKIGGVVQGTIIPAGGGTKPVDIEKYVIIVTTTGATNHGIRIKGFITIGNPNIIGSFTLNKPAGAPNFPNSLSCLLRPIIKIKIITARVIPVPPIPTRNESINGFVTILGNSSPAWNAFKFWSFNANHIGSKTELIIIWPCNPKNQNN